MFVIIAKTDFSGALLSNATAQQKLTQVLDIYCSLKHLLIFIFSNGDFNLKLKMYL